MRAVLVFLHRWAGLAMAGFLILVGLTGAILAFLPQLNHLLTPHLYPGPRAGIELPAAELARRAEELEPQARATRVFFAAPGTARVSLEARPGAPEIDFALYLDPVTGDALGRAKESGLPEHVEDILPFVDRLHWSLAAGEWGVFALGIVALVWTIDCFVAFYLTLPPNMRARGLLARWKPAWLVKRGASLYRLNFDLHRASGLWLFALLLMFAWSGVCFNLNAVYFGAMGAVFDFDTPLWKRPAPPPAPEGASPLSWSEAETIARALMAERAVSEGFRVDRPISFSLERERGLYVYNVHSSRDPGENYGGTTLMIDAYSGSMFGFKAPTGERNGETVTTWLVELHTANVFGLPYRSLACVCGVAIALLSVTGIIIWWKKRRARLHAAARPVTRSASAPPPDSRAPA
jgi:uncharacterized iron-regulated membrane protein